MRMAMLPKSVVNKYTLMLINIHFYIDINPCGCIINRDVSRFFNVKDHCTGSGQRRHENCEMKSFLTIAYFVLAYFKIALEASV